MALALPNFFCASFVDAEEDAGSLITLEDRCCWPLNDEDDDDDPYALEEDEGAKAEFEEGLEAGAKSLSMSQSESRLLGLLLPPLRGNKSSKPEFLIQMKSLMYKLNTF